MMHAANQQPHLTSARAKGPSPKRALMCRANERTTLDTSESFAATGAESSSQSTRFDRDAATEFLKEKKNFKQDFFNAELIREAINTKIRTENKNLEAEQVTFIKEQLIELLFPESESETKAKTMDSKTWEQLLKATQERDDKTLALTILHLAAVDKIKHERYERAVFFQDYNSLCADLDEQFSTKSLSNYLDVICHRSSGDRSDGSGRRRLVDQDCIGAIPSHGDARLVYSDATHYRRGSLSGSDYDYRDDDAQSVNSDASFYRRSSLSDDSFDDATSYLSHDFDPDSAGLDAMDDDSGKSTDDDFNAAIQRGFATYQRRNSAQDPDPDSVQVGTPPQPGNDASASPLRRTRKPSPDTNTQDTSTDTSPADVKATRNLKSTRTTKAPDQHKEAATTDSPTAQKAEKANKKTTLKTKKKQQKGEVDQSMDSKQVPETAAKQDVVVDSSQDAERLDEYNKAKKQALAEFDSIPQDFSEQPLKAAFLKLKQNPSAELTPKEVKAITKALNSLHTGLLGKEKDYSKLKNCFALACKVEQELEGSSQSEKHFQALKTEIKQLHEYKSKVSDELTKVTLKTLTKNMRSNPLDCSDLGKMLEMGHYANKEQTDSWKNKLAEFTRLKKVCAQSLEKQGLAVDWPDDIIQYEAELKKICFTHQVSNTLDQMKREKDQHFKFSKATSRQVSQKLYSLEFQSKALNTIQQNLLEELQKGDSADAHNCALSLQCANAIDTLEARQARFEARLEPDTYKDKKKQARDPNQLITSFEGSQSFRTLQAITLPQKFQALAQEYVDKPKDEYRLSDDPLIAELDNIKTLQNKHHGKNDSEAISRLTELCYAFHQKMQNTDAELDPNKFYKARFALSQLLAIRHDVQRSNVRSSQKEKLWELRVPTNVAKERAPITFEQFREYFVVPKDTPPRECFGKYCKFRESNKTTPWQSQISIASQWSNGDRVQAGTGAGKTETIKIMNVLNGANMKVISPADTGIKGALKPKDTDKVLLEIVLNLVPPDQDPPPHTAEPLQLVFDEHHLPHALSKDEKSKLIDKVLGNVTLVDGLDLPFKGSEAAKADIRTALANTSNSPDFFKMLLKLVKKYPGQFFDGCSALHAESKVVIFSATDQVSYVQKTLTLDAPDCLKGNQEIMLQLKQLEDAAVLQAAHFADCDDLVARIKGVQEQNPTAKLELDAYIVKLNGLKENVESIYCLTQNATFNPASSRSRIQNSVQQGNVYFNVNPKEKVLTKNERGKWQAPANTNHFIIQMDITCEEGTYQVFNPVTREVGTFKTKAEALDDAEAQGMGKGRAGYEMCYCGPNGKSCVGLDGGDKSDVERILASGRQVDVNIRLDQESNALEAFIQLAGRPRKLMESLNDDRKEKIHLNVEFASRNKPPEGLEAEWMQAQLTREDCSTRLKEKKAQIEHQAKLVFLDKLMDSEGLSAPIRDSFKAIRKAVLSDNPQDKQAAGERFKMCLPTVFLQDSNNQSHLKDLETKFKDIVDAFFNDNPLAKDNVPTAVTAFLEKLNDRVVQDKLTACAEAKTFLSKDRPYDKMPEAEAIQNQTIFTANFLGDKKTSPFLHDFEKTPDYVTATNLQVDASEKDTYNRRYKETKEDARDKALAIIQDPHTTANSKATKLAEFLFETKPSLIISRTTDNPELAQYKQIELTKMLTLRFEELEGTDIADEEILEKVFVALKPIDPPSSGDITSISTAMGAALKGAEEANAQAGLLEDKIQQLEEAKNEGADDLQKLASEKADQCRGVCKVTSSLEENQEAAEALLNSLSEMSRPTQEDKDEMQLLQELNQILPVIIQKSTQRKKLSAQTQTLGDLSIEQLKELSAAIELEMKECMKLIQTCNDSDFEEYSKIFPSVLANLGNLDTDFLAVEEAITLKTQEEEQQSLKLKHPHLSNTPHRKDLLHQAPNASPPSLKHAETLSREQLIKLAKQQVSEVHKQHPPALNSLQRPTTHRSHSSARRPPHLRATDLRWPHESPHPNRHPRSPNSSQGQLIPRQNTSQQRSSPPHRRSPNSEHTQPIPRQNTKPQRPARTGPPLTRCSFEATMATRNAFNPYPISDYE